VTGRTKENVIAGSAARRSMSCQIVSAKIGFHLHDPSGNELPTFLPDYELTQKLRRNKTRITIEKPPRE
jgi:hypothetical protein